MRLEMLAPVKLFQLTGNLSWFQRQHRGIRGLFFGVAADLVESLPLSRLLK